MGCSDSIERRIPPEWYQQFVALKMTKSEMAKLLRVYKKIDVDGSGTVDLPELFVFLNIEHTPFTERVFNIFDMNGTGKVDFREFVLSLWNYCTLSKATLGTVHPLIIPLSDKYNRNQLRPCRYLYL